MLQWPFVWVSFGAHMEEILLGIYREVSFLFCKVYVCLVLLESTKGYTKYLYQFTVQLAEHESSSWFCYLEVYRKSWLIPDLSRRMRGTKTKS